MRRILILGCLSAVCFVMTAALSPAAAASKRNSVPAMKYPGDKAFVEKAAQSNQTEIELSQLALERTRGSAGKRPKTLT